MKFPRAHTIYKMLLHLAPQMKGVLRRSGQIKTLEEVRKTYALRHSGSDIPLEIHDFAKISIGEIDFYLGFTASPPRLKKRRILNRDPLFSKIFLISMVVSSLALVSIFKVKIDPVIEPDPLPDRTATVLYKPEKFLKASSASVLSLSDKTQESKKILQPSLLIRKKSVSDLIQFQEDRNVDILKGAAGRIQDILGKSTASFGSTRREKGEDSLMTSGNRGQGEKGSRVNEGGAGQSLKNEGRVKTGSQVQIAIRSQGSDEVIVTGAVDRNAVAEAIMAHKDEFRFCYEREINAEHPLLSGQVGTRFVIGSNGRVTQAGIELSTLRNANVEQCVLTILKRIGFPTPTGGGVVEVYFPFRFSVAGHSW